MFLAVVLICLVSDANTCQLSYNTEQVFLTEEACVADTEAVKVELGYNPNLVVKAGCLAIPGEPV